MKRSKRNFNKKKLKRTYTYIDIHIRLHTRAHSFGGTGLLAHTLNNRMKPMEKEQMELSQK